ncbi:MAG TPA: hypothetical protein VMS65_14770, partial [Polyangiaceae bacterium]|nr:hypothetical protein [Polyangiaceae bacterium]
AEAAKNPSSTIHENLAISASWRFTLSPFSRADAALATRSERVGGKQEREGDFWDLEATDGGRPFHDFSVERRSAAS